MKSGLMILPLFFLFPVLYAVSSGHSNRSISAAGTQDYALVLPPPAPDSTDRYAILPYDSTTQFWPRVVGRNMQPSSLSADELSACFRLLEVRIEQENKAQPDRCIKPADYFFQLVPALTHHGHKVVYINALCLSVKQEFSVLEPDFNVAEQFLIVFDGGQCFFQLILDLYDNKVLGFSVNSVAEENLSPH